MGLEIADWADPTPGIPKSGPSDAMPGPKFRRSDPIETDESVVLYPYSAPEIRLLGPHPQFDDRSLPISMEHT